MSTSFVLLALLLTMSQALHIIRSAAAAAAGKEGPLCVLVHGLDSYSGTWKHTMDTLSVPCVAIDQRGCGSSPDLNDDTFTQDALVEDLHNVIQHELARRASSSTMINHQPVILVGHSLGGRVALGYAAKYPLAALVIEDMDIVPRPESPVSIPKVTSSYFQRQASSKEEMVAALVESYNYPKDRIEDWFTSGRISVKPDGTVWSNMNPDFRRLCYPHVLSTDYGQRDCRTIASAITPSLPCHVMVAGTEGTVCFEESIEEMKTILGQQLTVHRFPQAGHSIHGSDKEGFIKTMEDIIESVSLASSDGRS